MTDGALGAASSPTAARRPFPTVANERLLYRFTFLSLWLLPIMGFTMPTESATDSWQVLDLVKLVVLAIICFGGALALHANLGHPRFRRIIEPLLPFYVFFGWALVSVLWSPLKSVTIFQSGSLAAMLFFATSIGVISTRSENGFASAAASMFGVAGVQLGRADRLPDRSFDVGIGSQSDSHWW